MYKIYYILGLPITLILLGLIKIYKKLISPVLPNSCQFKPTCSTYGYESVKRFGFIKGSTLTASRILRCNAFSKGGTDLPKYNPKGEIKWVL